MTSSYIFHFEMMDERWKEKNKKRRNERGAIYYIGYLQKPV